MSASLLDDAFAHHVWATVRLIDTCTALTPEQLASAAPATFGSILDTLRHIVASDAFEMRNATGEPSPIVDLETAVLPELRAAMEANAIGWAGLLRDNPDPDAVLREVDPDDGYQRDAPLGIRLASALEHGDDHRSQVCTALTTLGVEPPDIDVWAFGLATDRSTDLPPDA